MYNSRFDSSHVDGHHVVIRMFASVGGSGGKICSRSHASVGGPGHGASLRRVVAQRYAGGGRSDHGAMMRHNRC